MGDGIDGERLFCRFFIDVLPVWVERIAAVVLDMAHGVFCLGPIIKLSGGLYYLLSAF